MSTWLHRCFLFLVGCWVFWGACSDAVQGAQVLDEGSLGNDGGGDADLDAGFDTPADGDAGTEGDDDGALDQGADEPTPWPVLVEVVGTGPAVGDGVLGPIFPFDLLIAPDLLIIVGEARADFEWTETTVSSGGFVLAIDRQTYEYRWHQSVGQSVYGVETVDGDLVVTGSFHGTINLETDGDPISLTSRGFADILIARLSLEGVFSWAVRAGSDGYDGAHGLAVNEGRVAVVGFISGEADLGDGCELDILTFPGDIDPVEGRELGIWDGILFEYDVTDGDCVEGTVFGHAGSDDFTFGIVPHASGFAVSGEAILPLSSRTTDGTTTAVGGPETDWAAPWLITVDSETAVTDSWFLDSAGRGRAVVSNGTDLFWTITASPGNVIGSADPVPIGLGVSVLEISTDGATATSIPGGSGDVMSIVLGDDTWVSAAEMYDPPHTVLARRNESGELQIHEASGAMHQPLRFATYGPSIFAVGAPVYGSIGDPPVDMSVGTQGGLMLLRLDGN